MCLPCSGVQPPILFIDFSVIDLFKRFHSVNLLYAKQALLPQHRDLSPENVKI